MADYAAEVIQGESVGQTMPDQCYRCGGEGLQLKVYTNPSGTTMRWYCRRCWDKIGTPYKPTMMSLDDLKKDLGKE